MKSTINTTVKFDVLFINNNPFDLLIIEALLGKHFNIISIDNYTRAMEVLENLHINLVIINKKSDEEVQERISILKKIRLDQRFNHIKLFALTSCNDQEHKFIKQGFDGVFTKPLIKEEVLEVVSKDF